MELVGLALGGGRTRSVSNHRYRSSSTVPQGHEEHHTVSRLRAQTQKANERLSKEIRRSRIRDTQ